MKRDIDAAMPEEQAAEFAALNSAAVDANASPEAVQAAPVLPSLADELTGLVTALIAVASPMFPSLKPIYTPEVISAASGAVAAVCKKHGWLSGGVMGEYAEEVTALIVCAPLALATVQAVRSDLAAMKPKAAPVAAPVVAAVTPPPDQPEAEAPAFSMVLERG